MEMVTNRVNQLRIKMQQVRSELMESGDSDENGRVKAIVNTKLQEALLFVEHLYDKNF